MEQITIELSNQTIRELDEIAGEMELSRGETLIEMMRRGIMDYQNHDTGEFVG